MSGPGEETWILVGSQFYWAKNSVTIIKSGFSLVSLTNKDVSVVWDAEKSGKKFIAASYFAAAPRLIIKDFKGLITRVSGVGSVSEINIKL